MTDNLKKGGDKMKLFIALVLALCLTLVASPVFADAEIEVSDIEVERDGDDAEFSGSVAVTADASCEGFICGTGAGGYAYYTITSPSGDVVSSGGQSDVDYDFGCYSSESDASFVYEWSTTVGLTEYGHWVAEHGGGAWYYEITICPPTFDFGHASASSSAVCHHNPMVLLQKHPVLMIDSQGEHALFFPSDGWNEVTTKDISCGDVFIPAGTTLLLDGKWHKRTFIDDGVYKYGNAKRVAETVEFK